MGCCQEVCAATRATRARSDGSLNVPQLFTVCFPCFEKLCRTVIAICGEVTSSSATPLIPQHVTRSGCTGSPRTLPFARAVPAVQGSEACEHGDAQGLRDEEGQQGVAHGVARL